MARLPRLVVPDYPHHLTQRGVRSMDIFTGDEDRVAYLSFIAEECNRYDVSVLAWCLMTNHVHFVAVPKTENSLARAFGEAHRRYTRMRNFAEKVRGYLFQGRFSSTVLYETHLYAAVRYVELNPVSAGMTKLAGDYAWSSARFHLGVIEEDPLVNDRSLQGLISKWDEFLGSNDAHGIAQVVAATRSGRPAGDEDFLTSLEKTTGRRICKKPAGRPRIG